MAAVICGSSRRKGKRMSVVKDEKDKDLGIKVMEKSSTWPLQ